MVRFFGSKSPKKPEFNAVGESFASIPAWHEHGVDAQRIDRDRNLTSQLHELLESCGGRDRIHALPPSIYMTVQAAIREASETNAQPNNVDVKDKYKFDVLAAYKGRKGSTSIVSTVSTTIKNSSKRLSIDTSTLSRTPRSPMAHSHSPFAETPIQEFR